MTDEEYISAADAGELLGVSARQAMRYGAGDDAPVRTRRDGRRVLFHAEDVQELAAQLKDRRDGPRQQRAEMVRFVDIFDYLRERDVRIKELEEQLAIAQRYIGQLEGTQETVKLLRDELAMLKAEEPPEPARRSWWQRLLGNS